MDDGIAGGEDETDPKWTVKISTLTLYLMQEEGYYGPGRPEHCFSPPQGQN